MLLKSLDRREANSRRARELVSAQAQSEAGSPYLKSCNHVDISNDANYITLNVIHEQEKVLARP